MKVPLSPAAMACVEDRLRTGLRNLLASNPDLEELLKRLSGGTYGWAVVGGLPRIWALEQDVGDADVDIVVGAPPQVLSTRLQAWSDATSAARSLRTKMGGYRLRVGGRPVDVWPAKFTVGLVEQRVHDQKRYRAVAKSAALSSDSCVVTAKGTVYDAGFFLSLSTGILQLNHWAPHAEERVARKAARLCRDLGFSPDIRLQLLLEQYGHI